MVQLEPSGPPDVSTPQDFISQRGFSEQDQARAHWHAIGDINLVPAAPELLPGVSVPWRVQTLPFHPLLPCLALAQPYKV